MPCRKYCVGSLKEEAFDDNSTKTSQNSSQQSITNPYGYKMLKTHTHKKYFTMHEQ